MKFSKTTLLKAFCLSACIIPSKVNAQQLQTIKKTVVFKYTADWCAPCGDWGWDLFESIHNMELSDTSFRAHCINVHYQSNQAFLNTPLLDSLTNNTTTSSVNGFPHFVVDNDNTSMLYSVGQITSKIDSEMMIPATMAIGFDAAFTAPDSLEVQTKSKFLIAETTTEYSVAAYILEDSVMGTQTSKVGIIPHHILLRDAVQHGVWGQTITTNGGTIGQEFVNNYKMSLPPSWIQSHLSVLVLVYKKNLTTGKYDIVNAILKKPSGTPTSLSTIDNNNIITIYPNPATNSINIASQSTFVKNVNISDISGRIVMTIDMPQNNETLDISSLPSGIYLINMSTEDGKYRTKFIKK